MTVATSSPTLEDLKIEKEDPPDYDELILPDLPNGWSWQGGSVSSKYYTYWFGTKYSMGGPLAGWGRRLGGYFGEVYWDQGGHGHCIRVEPVVRIDDIGDKTYGYPDFTDSFDDAQTALNAVPEKIQELIEKKKRRDA